MALERDLFALITSHLDDPSVLCRLSGVSRAMRSASACDSAWAPVFRRMFGSALLEAARESLHEHDADSISIDNIPRWMCIRPYLPWYEQELTECLDMWRRAPSLKIAFRILEIFLVTDFTREPLGCLANVRGACGGMEEDESRSTAACFLFWASREGVEGREQFRRKAIEMMTTKTPKAEEGAAPDLERERTKAIRQVYVRQFDTKGLSLITATRLFLEKTSMPTEAGRLCRIMWDFAGVCRERMTEKDPLYGQSHDVVYLLVWAALVLNADAHNPQVKQKMLVSEW
eukprot:CAMPEP_0173415934 /NCGR_PEP_ID=MMETSP1356-20130122/85123_1 /TAXON_ID=77927 ORGANISM="Hemiselmis virescens, Strain PCC157" /NCGR_SAMPLE_ID=MMETSP1356 /ASSEMBLY_ACC=CAM_ASM_000847 /LENGTH=287 /DNA_ID=CAMNT_0014378223 /DNA_START=198 /DNA_END=1058 /DNA_ORIENTATION=+